MLKIQFDPKSRFLKNPSVIFLTKNQVASLRSLKLEPLIHDQITRLVKSKRFSAANGEIFPLFINQILILVVGLGEDKKISKTSLRVSVKQALESSYLSGVDVLNIFPHAKDDETICGVIEGVQIGTYKWQKYIHAKKDKENLSTVIIACAPKKIYDDCCQIADGVNYVRDLVNDNSNVVHSTYIENEIKRLLRGKAGIHVDILGEKVLKKKGLNLLLAVNSASKYPPRLMIARYQGASKNSEWIAIVGKGITFDAGGLSLKPTGSIETMRCDMAGAAAVLGILKNVISLKIKKNIIFVIGIAENAIGSSAYKPGDVVKSYAGKTVEITNTDAEGRLVLADAISYVVKNFKPSKIVDLATLTGACPVALGNDYAGLMSNDDDFANSFLKSAEKTDDRLWRLPLYEELKTHLKSQYADMKSTGMPRGIGSTISAAEFLHQFVGDTAWVHLDIAGTAFADGQGRLYFNYGATGFGVRLLTHFLQG